MEHNEDVWRPRRDRKMFKMIDPDHPAWLVDEKVVNKDDMVQYEIVHRWAPGGWARRRYSYDVVSDVVHFRGSTPLDDDEITKMKPEQRLHHPATLDLL